MARKGVHRKRNGGSGVLIAVILFVIIILISASYLMIAPSGNTLLRKALNGRETPADIVIRNKSHELLSGHDNEVLQSVGKVLEQNTIPQLIKKTESERSTVDFLKSELNIDDSSANNIAEEIFSNEHLMSIKSDITNSDWKSAYENLNELTSSGELDLIKSRLSINDIEDAEKLQEEAREMLDKKGND